MKVTLKDIARIGGISESTVSRALAGDPRISESTRQRVQELANQLDYRPNALARSLAVRRTRTLGIIVCTLGNTFYAEIVRGIEDTALASGYTVILCTSSYNTKKEHLQLRVLEEKRVDGILVTPSSMDLADVAAMHERGVKSVLMDTDDTGDSGLSCVGLDHARGAEDAVAHLIEQGHHRIGFISGLMTLPTVAAAHRGYRQALQRAHLPYSPELVKAYADLGVESAYRGAQELLAMAEPPTAVFSFADIMAIGVYRAAHEAGLRIPADLAVIGYDNIPSSEFLAPSLTTVDQGEYQLGRAACQLLIGEIEQGNLLHQMILLRPRLIVRQSSVFTVQVPAVAPAVG